MKQKNNQNLTESEKIDFDKMVYFTQDKNELKIKRKENGRKPVTVFKNKILN